MIQAYYHPDFATPLGKHIMPITKFALVAEQLKTRKYVDLIAPQALEEDALEAVHAASYIAAVKTGEPRVLAEAQKFPWSPRLYPSVLLTNGAVLAAAEEALRTGSGAAVASGFHHAHRDHGEGFCTFNGLVVAGECLRKRGKIRNLAVLDMDLHYGNGTALLARERPWLKVLSLYGNDYWNNVPYRDVAIRQHEDGPNHLSFPLSAGCTGADLFAIMEEQLPRLIVDGKPECLLYQAGADPYREDPYSPLALSIEDLYERDRRVFEFTRKHAIPVAWVLAGGYTEDISKVVKIHVNTFEAWESVYGNKKI